MTKVSKTAKQEAYARLREWIKPGDKVRTILDHVSRSGMSRKIRIVLIDKDGDTTHPNYAIANLLEYSQDKCSGALIVGGCGMDMGFHLVHSLGYALFGEEASKGEGLAANALREAIWNAPGVKFYMMQGGRKVEPDCTKPAPEWFGAAGYALKQEWL